MENKFFVMGIITAVVVVIGFLMFSHAKAPIENVKTNTADVQKIVLSQKNYNYAPKEIHVKAGQPVSISLDSSVNGCRRGIIINDFGITKDLPTPEDTLTFTPEKAGTYVFTCSMGMTKGKIIVE
ncbi:cupredoxin domain-containing protein [Candidatus Pacearchaeota archaeon]|nr:cupredoxin domain-containing protein [Candidatus Pacearchaeota archaeon]